MHNMKQNIRKIIKIEYSRLVTLPLFWLTLVGLDAGGSVEMSLGNRKELVLKPVKDRQND